MLRSGLSAVVAAAVIVCHAATAHALQFTSTFQSIKIEARPGETQTQSFTLTLAPTEHAVRFHAKVEDWWSSEDGKQSYYRPVGTVSRSSGRWVALNPVEAEVKPGETLEVRVTVAVPRNAAPGGYWSALTVDELPAAGGSRGVGMHFLASISVGIFVNVVPVTKSIRIADVVLSGDSAAVRVRNTGTAPVFVDGRFEFLKPGGKEAAPVATVALPRTTVVLDPAPVRLITARLPDPAALPSGRYLVRAILDIGIDHYIGAQKEIEIRREPAAHEAR